LQVGHETKNKKKQKLSFTVAADKYIYNSFFKKYDFYIFDRKVCTRKFLGQRRTSQTSYIGQSTSLINSFIGLHHNYIITFSSLVQGCAAAILDSLVTICI